MKNNTRQKKYLYIYDSSNKFFNSIFKEKKIYMIYEYYPTYRIEKLHS